MTTTTISIITIISMVSYRAILNYSKLKATQKHLNNYEDYLLNPTFEFHQNKEVIINLFKSAGIANFVVPRMEPAGFGMVTQYELDGFSNITLLDEQIVGTIRGKFHATIGVYRSRMNQSFNPIFWIEYGLYFPRHIASYFGFKMDGGIKVIQIIYWIVGMLAAFGLLQQVN